MSDLNYLTIILFAFLGGILPALIWLLFWLREDSKNPEPRKLIFQAFLFGMLAVPFVFYIQKFINLLLIGNQNISDVFFVSYFSAIVVIILWSTIEEVAKYLAAHFSGLIRKDFDEPIDAMIYLITAALGFSAMENAVFIFAPLLAGETTTAIITGNLRFVGATLLHVATSAAVGVFVAFSYYKNSRTKMRYLFTGLVAAIALHTIFNSFIIRAEKFTLVGFSLVWLSIVAVILIFEKVKKIDKRKEGKIDWQEQN